MTGGPNPDVLEALMEQVRTALAEHVHRPVQIGVCGSQASGKSTLCAAAVAACAAERLKAATLSIDDIYLTRAEREALAREVHPLLVTRGPPGTHDVVLGNRVIDDLRRGEASLLPRFDKPRDDRAAEAAWEEAPAGCDVLFFEGWCIGAVPQPKAALAKPVNALEAEEDPDGRWRRYANEALAGEYQALFARLDRLVLIAAPSFEVVHGWRIEQEEGLRARSTDPHARFMDAEAIARFIAHYERLTRHIVDEMPARTDLLVRIDDQRRPLEIRVKSGDGMSSQRKP
jgi:D-glycerate 3-kinase